jgi:hypothetical protein
MKTKKDLPNIVKNIIGDRDFQRQYNTEKYIKRTSFTKVMGGGIRK